MIATRRLMLPLFVCLHLTLLRAEDNKQPTNNTATHTSDPNLPIHPLNPQPSPIPAPPQSQGQGSANQNTNLASQGQGIANQNADSSSLEKDAVIVKLNQGQGTAMQNGHQEMNAPPQGPNPKLQQPSQTAEQTLQKLFQQVKNAQESFWNSANGPENGHEGVGPGTENKGWQDDRDANKNSLPASQNLEKTPNDLNHPADMATKVSKSVEISDKEKPGESEGGKVNQGSPPGTNPKEPQQVKGSGVSYVQGKPEAAGIKAEQSQQPSQSLNATSSSSRTRETLSSLKYAMLTVCMVIAAVAVMVLVIFSTSNKRRRRQYDRCRGLGDDCEMHSNFQLVNNDERLGIRTSSNYLM